MFDFSFMHTCIRVLDLEKSIKFYEEALGMHIAVRKDFETFSLVYMTDDNKTHELELTYNVGKEEPYELGTGYSHIALNVSNIEKVHAFHTEKGYEVTPLKKISADSNSIYFITDPDGYKIELIER